MMRNWHKTGLQLVALLLCAGACAQTPQTSPITPSPVSPAPVSPAPVTLAPATPPVPAAVTPSTAPVAPTVVSGPAGGAKSNATVTVTSGTVGSNTTAGGSLQGTALDRLVAVVNGDLVLESDIDEERRMVALQPVRDPGGRSSREQAIERLINRALILQQAKLQAQAPVSDVEVTEELKKLRGEIPACKEMRCETDAGWQAFLKQNGLTQAEVMHRWRERMEVLRYIELRFRSGVRITPREIREYFDQKMLPEYKQRGVTPPAVDTVADRIEEVLLQEQVTNLLQDWLKSLRAQGTVQTMPPGEMAP